jgi:oxygen-independent coproporphyrinogen-3 oxidase
MTALERLIDCGFPVVNADLIYGFAGQSREVWRRTVKEIASRRPQEVFLYPLYVRPETGLGKRGDAAARRADLYRTGRDVLLEAGYRQRSLRNFLLPGVEDAGRRRCQSDGMIGLGCGARSYAERLHYSTPFAVARADVAGIVKKWIEGDDAAFGQAVHGHWLDEDERRRRHVILSMLDEDGLDEREYEERFGAHAAVDFPQLDAMTGAGWLKNEEGRLRLTESGMERSDEIGLAFYSPAARRALAAFVQ